MSRQHLSRLDRLEQAFRTQQPDPAQEDRLRRACARLAALLETDLPVPDGPVYRGGDPAERLQAAERRLSCADR